MLLFSLTRCFIFYLLIIHSSVIGWDELFDGLFDPKDQNVKKIDDTRDHISIKKEQVVHERKPNYIDEKTCPSTSRYRTVLVAYRSFARSWSDQLSSDDTKEYRLIIHFAPSELAKLKRFASSTDYDQDNIVHDGVLGLPVIAAIFIFIFHNRTRPAQWLASLFITIFIFSILQNWYTLYQEEQAKIAHQLMKGLPKHCQGQFMGFFNKIATLFSRFAPSQIDDCLEYHKAVHVTPYLKATLVQALSITIAQFFITPLGLLGEGLSQFFSGAMRHVSILASPFVLIASSLIGLVLIFVVFRYKLHLPFGLGMLRPHNNQEQILIQLRNEIAQLRNENQQIRLQLEQQTNPQLQHN